MNTIRFKIKKSIKLEILISEIQSVLLNKEFCNKYKCDISKICDLGIIGFVESNVDNTIDVSIDEKITNNKSLKKNTVYYFLLFLNNNEFKISDLISIDYLKYNKSKIVAKTWRDIKKSREEKY